MYREIKSLGVAFWFIEQFDLFNHKVLKYGVSIFGLNAKTKNLQLIAVSLLLFLYSFNSSFTFFESSSIVK